MKFMEDKQHSLDNSIPLTSMRHNTHSFKIRSDNANDFVTKVENQINEIEKMSKEYYVPITTKNKIRLSEIKQEIEKYNRGEFLEYLKIGDEGSNYYGD